jgi:hypothetical protein
MDETIRGLYEEDVTTHGKFDGYTKLLKVAQST